MHMKQNAKASGGFLKKILKGLKFVFSPRVSAEISTLAHGSTLLGKRILITGGGRGLGYHIAKKCIDEGATVLICGRDDESLRDAASKLGERCVYLRQDISRIEGNGEFIHTAMQKLGGGIDCLVNNAGVSHHEKDFSLVTPENFDEQFSINLRGPYFLTQAYIQQLLSQKDTGGNIVFVSSERGLQCDFLPYGLTKAGVNSLTRGLALRYISNGIRVNAVAPGVTASDMVGIRADGDLYRENASGKRVFLPEEVAEVVAFLLSDISRSISGEVIACDQGNYLQCYWQH